MTDFEMCRDNGSGWCEYHVGRRFHVCATYAVLALSRIEKVEQSTDKDKKPVIQVMVPDQKPFVKKTPEMFVADATAITKRNPNTTTLVSEVNDQGNVSCVGARYGVCSCDPNNAWLSSGANQLAGNTQQRYPFFFCNSCATILESKGIATARR